MLGAQGIFLLMPTGPGIPRADLAVLSPPGTPEYLFYCEKLRSMDIPLVVARDPLRALALAIAYPSAAFESLQFGIDPGRRCGLVVLGDGRLLRAEKIPCEGVGPAITEYARRIPAGAYRVYVGDGQGLLEALQSLAEEGVPYTVVGEEGTTSYPVRGPLRSVLKDKDLLASLTIALRGSNGGAHVGQRLPQ